MSCEGKKKKKIEEGIDKMRSEKRKYSYLATHGYYRNSPW